MAGLAGGGGWAAYHYTGRTVVEIPPARARKAEVVISVRTRGEIKSNNSMMIMAPQVPSLKITRLAESGKPIRKGDIVVQFDEAQQEQFYLDRRPASRRSIPRSSG
jgi:multidrug efflux pump subunit AcrA (membrane-fusion protein)